MDYLTQTIEPLLFDVIANVAAAAPANPLEFIDAHLAGRPTESDLGRIFDPNASRLLFAEHLDSVLAEVADKLLREQPKDPKPTLQQAITSKLESLKEPVKPAEPAPAAADAVPETPAQAPAKTTAVAASAAPATSTADDNPAKQGETKSEAKPTTAASTAVPAAGRPSTSDATVTGAHISGRYVVVTAQQVDADVVVRAYDPRRATTLTVNVPATEPTMQQLLQKYSAETLKEHVIEFLTIDDESSGGPSLAWNGTASADTTATPATAATQSAASPDAKSDATPPEGTSSKAAAPAPAPQQSSSRPSSTKSIGGSVVSGKHIVLTTEFEEGVCHIRCYEPRSMQTANVDVPSSSPALQARRCSPPHLPCHVLARV